MTVKSSLDLPPWLSVTQLSHNYLNNLLLLSNWWWEHRFQQGLKDVLQTLEYWHGLNYICRSETEFVPHHLKNTLHHVLMSSHVVWLENCPWLPVLHAVWMLKAPKGTWSSEERKCIRLKLKIIRVEEGLQLHGVIHEARRWSEDLKEPHSVPFCLNSTKGSNIPFFGLNLVVWHRF